MRVITILLTQALLLQMMFSSKAAIISDCLFMSIWFCCKKKVLYIDELIKCHYKPPEPPSSSSPAPSSSVSPSPTWLAPPDSASAPQGSLSAASPFEAAPVLDLVVAVLLVPRGQRSVREQAWWTAMIQTFEPLFFDWKVGEV